LAVRIRLKRFGARNRIQYRIVVSDAKMPRDGRFIEEIGSYNPLPIEEKVTVKKQRLQYWLDQGAQLSDSVRSLLKRQNKKERKLASK